MKSPDSIILRVNEIFHALQGEGGRTGHPSIFIRLAGCNLKCPFCDTEHEAYTEMTLEQIVCILEMYPCKDIVWTGGEPTLQLDNAVTYYFHEQGYFQCLESNGTGELPEWLDYVVISPKHGATFHPSVINGNVDEIRIPVSPSFVWEAWSPLLKWFSGSLFLSPVLLGTYEDKQTIELVYTLCLKHNINMSIQTHKLIGVK